MADILRHIYVYITAYMYIHIMTDILWQVYYGRYSTADTLQQIYYGRYMTADILRQIYYGRYITADILRHIYYGRRIMADIFRQIYYSRYTTPNTLRRYIAYHKNGHISANLQRQTFSIAVFEPACCHAAPQKPFLDRDM